PATARPLSDHRPAAVRRSDIVEEPRGRRPNAGWKGRRRARARTPLLFPLPASGARTNSWLFTAFLPQAGREQTGGSSRHLLLASGKDKQVVLQRVCSCKRGEDKRVALHGVSFPSGARTNGWLVQRLVLASGARTAGGSSRRRLLASGARRSGVTFASARAR